MPPVSLDEDVTRVNLRLREFAASMSGVDYFDANDYLCPDQMRDLRGEDGLPRYFDPYHMTVPASRRRGSRIVACDGVPSVFDLGGR